jgi:hypothetical protein
VCVCVCVSVCSALIQFTHVNNEVVCRFHDLCSCVCVPCPRSTHIQPKKWHTQVIQTLLTIFTMLYIHSLAVTLFDWWRNLQPLYSYSMTCAAVCMCVRVCVCVYLCVDMCVYVCVHHALNQDIPWNLKQTVLTSWIVQQGIMLAIKTIHAICWYTLMQFGIC